VAPVKRALLVTEKLGGDQRWWDGCAIHPNERSLRPCGSFVDGPRDQFFPVPVSPKIKKLSNQNAQPLVT